MRNLQEHNIDYLEARIGGILRLFDFPMKPFFSSLTNDYKTFFAAVCLVRNSPFLGRKCKEIFASSTG